jgi:hypothetical protein
LSSSPDGSLSSGGYHVCFHACPGSGCSHVSIPDDYTHCECHHVDFDSAVPDSGFKFPTFNLPEVPDSGSWSDRLGLIEPELPTLPSLPSLPPIPIPSFVLPPVLLPPIPSPSDIVPPNPDNFDLGYFAYSGGFPEFKFSAIFEDFKSELSKKIDLSAYDRLSSGGSAEHLVWNIDYNILGVRFGPFSIDLTNILSDVSTYSGVNIIRSILVFILYTLFIYFIFRMLFFT